MNYIIFLLILNFFVHLKTEKIYKVVTRRLSLKPIVDNTIFNFVSRGTIFCHNGNLGLIVQSRFNGSYIFITSKVVVHPNSTYTAEPLQEENILPLNLNLNLSVYYPNILHFNGTYYLIYTEGNSETGENSFAFAATNTPSEAKSWSKIGNIIFSNISLPTEDATILWNGSKNISFLFFGYLTRSSGIGTSLLTWGSSVKHLLLPRPGYFDGKGIQPGASPIQLKSGDYLFFYNADNKIVSIGYVILDESDPTQIIQRSDDPIMKPEFDWENTDITSNGLIKDPNGCPPNATETFGSEYEKTVECFIGVYSGHQTNISLYRVTTGWKNFTSTTTPAEITTVKDSESTSQVSLDLHNNTSTPMMSTTMMSIMTTAETQQIVATTMMVNATITSHTTNSKTVIIITATLVPLLLVTLAVVITIYCCKKIKQRRSLVGIIVKQHEMNDKETKNLAEIADRFQLQSNKISINYDEIVGSGSTATVYKGFLNGISALSETKDNFALKHKYANCKVAIKVPKEMNRSETEQIMRELQAMRQIGYHAHIAILLGWCFQNDLPSLVFELAQYDLFTFIRKNRDSQNSCMPLKDILSIAWQISTGMEYVASFNMVHRDIAARNILLYEGLHAKISDFGLCCHCDESFTYQATLNKKLPVRWLSLEALADRQFSEKSDVWAFGVLLYEMCTNGALPYALMSNYEILKFLQNGKRLEKPETSNEKLYSLMLDCWKESTDQRLFFVDVTQRLQRYLEEETHNYGYLSVAADEMETLYA